MAANTDKVRLATPTFATTLAASISGSGDTSMTLSSTTGLTTLTAVTLTIDATDSSGNLTPDLQETVTGVVNSDTVIDLLRGQDGTTAQAHASGANVVMWFTAVDWNDFSNAFLHQHTQTGAHTSITTDTINSTGNATLGGTLGVTGNTSLGGNVSVAGTSTLTGAISGAGYSLATISNPCKFSVYNNTSQSIGSSQTQVQFNTELYDTGSNFASNAFTAPAAGFYHFDATLQVTATTSLTATYIELRVNGTIAREVGAAASSTSNTGAHISADLQLAASDVVTVYCAGNVSFTCAGSASYLTWFNGRPTSAT